MSSGLRTTFWVHVVVALVFGLGFLFVPNFLADLFNMGTIDPIVPRIYGITILALGVSSFLAALSPAYDRVEIVVQMEIFYTFAAALFYAYAVLFMGAPVLLWLVVAMMAIFFVAFGYFYWQERAAHPVQPAVR